MILVETRADEILKSAETIATDDDDNDRDNHIHHPRPSLRINQQTTPSTGSRSSSSYLDLKSMANESLRY